LQRCEIPNGEDDDDRGKGQKQKESPADNERRRETQKRKDAMPRATTISSMIDLSIQEKDRFKRMISNKILDEHLAPFVLSTRYAKIVAVMRNEL